MIQPYGSCRWTENFKKYATQVEQNILTLKRSAGMQGAQGVQGAQGSAGKRRSAEQLMTECDYHFEKISRPRWILVSSWNPTACRQRVLPDNSVFIGQKLVENIKAKKLLCDIWVFFKQCACVSNCSWQAIPNLTKLQITSLYDMRVLFNGSKESKVWRSQ